MLIRRRLASLTGGPAMLAVSLALALSACSGGPQRDKKTPQVGYSEVKLTEVPLEIELPGRTAPYRQGQVRPQVSGVLMRRLFTEGQLVHQGQPLYQIDPSVYRAAADQAAANLVSAQASAEAAKIKADRYKPLAQDQAVAQQDYTDAAATARTSAAAVAQYRAALNAAKVNLRFTTVPAPITGRIGRSLYTEGALVTANQTDPLSVISALDPIYVDIQQSSASLMKLRKEFADGGIKEVGKVALILDDGSEYPIPGTLEFSEVTVDTATGTVALRAKFANPDGTLLPGLFVRTRVSQGKQSKVVLVPQGALSRDPRGGATVMVLGAGNKAEIRKVSADRTIGDQWVVTDGLKPGDKLITQGLGKIRPGQVVVAVPDTTPQGIKPAGKKPSAK
ncbi:efflux RND transporter periplasmic adaptor subunit [Novosphingobium sp. KACC 22771]|uniref:efflux RND transporter periplasmic adaptor subunit n=1 Tax=Novosphingobium sp. KACC 22771 TaxID=3025670 RepID=UPI00236529EF|nr:efflux RND transporter periplasmic adaptor subunit [Novosphingobium sp. KACC 22771]WDF71132.1 efflux RND transporter periplasmic adaptor subunit [Novosphingobium sp. KACC 22771]